MFREAKVSGVFSAHAEVVPSGQVSNPVPVSILRARGGSSQLIGVISLGFRYSPRTRR